MAGERAREKALGLGHRPPGLAPEEGRPRASRRIKRYAVLYRTAMGHFCVIAEAKSPLYHRRGAPARIIDLCKVTRPSQSRIRRFGAAQ